LKIVRTGGELKVKVGETFGIERAGLETAGFTTDIVAPAGIVRLGSERKDPEGFGGQAHVIEKFSCRNTGRFPILFRRNRPWENEAGDAESTVIFCEKD